MVEVANSARALSCRLGRYVCAGMDFWAGWDKYAIWNRRTPDSPRPFDGIHKRKIAKPNRMMSGSWTTSARGKRKQKRTPHAFP